MMVLNAAVLRNISNVEAIYDFISNNELDVLLDKKIAKYRKSKN